MIVTRRALVVGTPGFLMAARTASATEDWLSSLPPELARIERASGGRLGVAVLDTATGRTVSHRGNERFAMCSTFKMLAAAAALAEVDRGRTKLDQRVRVEFEDLVTYSPITKERTGGEGMSLAELCDAAITVSDNTAANLLLRVVGGPEGLTAYLRSIGDSVTRLDRTETTLNEAVPGDPRDTTSPLAMAETCRKLAFGDVLSPASRARLTGWLVANTTGDTRLRAGLPKDWRVGDKTGTGDYGTANDIAVIWPPGRTPLVISSYLTETAKATAEQRNTVHASVGRAVAAALRA